MAKNRRRTTRTYTNEEKIALVTEIERRYRAGDGPPPAMRPVEVSATAPEITALVPLAIDSPTALAEHEPPMLAVETAVAVLRALAC